MISNGEIKIVFPASEQTMKLHYVWTGKQTTRSFSLAPKGNESSLLLVVIWLLVRGTIEIYHTAAFSIYAIRNSTLHVPFLPARKE